ncbi:2-phospho-L-lactate guanylyltransferase [Nocardioides sp. REDSEA-S30_B4]|uniref:2-phospho-L-lactate guanylyltransferase n=1 Tax=Nocardioides sp. REDSEA-S30_B4 TaxID=1811552 RepID=UPI000AA449E8|nr:2-phospho-L-lactate guanylyltransferase [Nocardioides sp. REDSEA-S30_B4]
MSVPAHPPTYAVVVPVKPPARGKSRLVGIADGAREELAAAFALDTVTACLAAAHVGAVLVATDDARFSAALAATGAPCIPDGDSSDLNATLRQTAAEARRRWPSMRPVALCADLPALDPADLDAALASPVLAGGVAGFVADAAGIGTTLYSASWEAFAPRYGEGSRLAHLDAGAVEVTGPLTTLRRDVDDVPDLQAAAALGVGTHTRRVLDALGLF